MQDGCTRGCLGTSRVRNSTSFARYYCAQIAAMLLLSNNCPPPALSVDKLLRPSTSYHQNLWQYNRNRQLVVVRRSSPSPSWITNMVLSHHQLQVLTLVERSASILSVIGIATIVGTFSLSRQFRNPIQRIVFINAFYNIFDVTATFISLSGPEAGNSSRLCQFQGFLMQM